MSDLPAVRELLSNPQSWMQGEYTNSDKTCFCVLGALAHVRGVDPTFETLNPHDPDIRKLALTISPDISPGLFADVTVADFNDAEERNHPDILNLLDKAIANAPL